MLKRGWIAAAAFCAAIALPTLAAAQTVAYAVYGGYTNVRSGPSTNYQVIARLAPGTGVDVLGCLETRAWCNIIVEDLEGWVYAGRLEFVRSGRRYLVPNYYAHFGAPYVVFRFGDRDRYDRHRYRRDRDRYRDREDVYVPPPDCRSNDAVGAPCMSPDQPFVVDEPDYAGQGELRPEAPFVPPPDESGMQGGGANRVDVPTETGPGMIMCQPGEPCPQ
jgi:uncharacterized protein YraI